MIMVKIKSFVKKRPSKNGLYNMHAGVLIQINLKFPEFVELL